MANNDFRVKKGLDVAGSATIHGDLTVEGAFSALTETFETFDPNVTLNKGGTDAQAEGAGMTIERDGTFGSMVFDSSVSSLWKAGLVGSESELVTVDVAQTLINKTIDAASNTIIGLTQMSDINNAIAVHNSLSSNVHGVVSAVVGVDDIQVLTNKTIDANGNTISNLTNTSIAAAAAIARSKIANGTIDHVVINNATGGLSSEQYLNKVRGGTGADMSSVSFPSSGTLATLTDVSGNSSASITAHANLTETHGATGAVVGTTNTQTLTNKIYDGGSASATNQIKLPQNSTTNLEALSDIESLIVYDSTTKKPKYNDGTGWQPMGGGLSKWATSTAYAVDDVIFNDTYRKIYQCKSAHTSGTFLTDLAAAKWVALSAQEDQKKTINYLDNSRAEFDTAGWTVYANTTAGTAPDNFGGSAGGNLTWTRNTTTPLGGVADFKLRHLANVQGEGVYRQFTLEKADLAQMLTFKCYIDTTETSNVVSEELKFFLVSSSDNFSANFDVQPLQPNGILLGKGIFNAQIQTHATNTAYRLCIHETATNSATWNVYFDRMELGPTQYAFGPAKQNLGNLTTTGGWSSNCTYTGKYWRDGSFLIGQVYVLCSSTPSGSLTINMPNGFVIDTTKLSAAGECRIVDSIANYSDAGSSNYTGGAYYNSTTSLQAYWLDGAAASSAATSVAVTQATPFTFNTSDKVEIWYKVPIVGWEEYSQMSDNAETRVVDFIAGLKQPSGSISSETTVIMPSVDKDTHGGYSTVTGLYSVKANGDYDVDFFSRISGSATAGAYYTTKIYVNAVEKHRQNEDCTGANRSYLTPKIRGTVSCVYGDTIKVTVTTNLTSAVWDASLASLNIAMKQGPASIAASEKVFAKYTVTASSANLSFAHNAYEIVDYDTKIYDSHNTVTTGASWKFTAPRSSLYSIKAKAYWTNTTNMQAEIMKVYKNGSAEQLLTDPNTFQAEMQGSTDVWLNANDYIDVRLLHLDSGSAARTIVSTSGYTIISIASQGGI